MGGNPKLGPTFSHDILQYWDEHSQLFTLNSQHEISILGTKKSQTRPNIFPMIFYNIGINIPNVSHEFPNILYEIVFPNEIPKNFQAYPSIGKQIPMTGL